MSLFGTIYAADLPHRAVAVYMYLKDRANKDGVCWPAIPTMARDLRLSRSTVKRALDDLVSGGYLEKESRYRDNGGLTSNRYKILEKTEFPAKDIVCFCQEPGGTSSVNLQEVLILTKPTGRKKKKTM